MSENGKKRKKAEGDQDPKVTEVRDMYLSPKRQCIAHSKASGQQCRRLAMRGLRVCVVHGGATRAARAKAAERIQQASGFAADLLVEFMASPEQDVQLRTRIAQDLLNRAGVSEKTVLQIGIDPPKSFLDFVGDAIVDLEVSTDDLDGVKVSTKASDIIDAEVVVDDALDAAPMTRGDRAHNRDRQRAARRAEDGRRARSRDDSERRELEALARHNDRDAAESRAQIGRGREAYLTALDGGASPDEAARIAAYAADRKDRATRSGGRSSEARMTRE